MMVLPASLYMFASDLLARVPKAAHPPLEKGDAPAICMVGLGVVFSGLALLCIFMLCLMRLLEPAAADGDSSQVEPRALDPDFETEEVLARDEETVAEPSPVVVEEEPEWQPEKRQEMVPMTLLSAAVMAYHLFECNQLQLGRKSSFLLDGVERKVTILSAGYVNRVLVDGEEITFNLSEVAHNDKIGRKITPADI